MAYNFGAILGYASLGFLADRFGRKPITMLYFAAGLRHDAGAVPVDQDLTLLLVAAAVNAFFTLGQYSWMAVWLPELFPTRSRATGLAFTFNAPRFIAFLGPLFAGVLIVQFGGFSRAAMTIACIYILGFCVDAVPAGDQRQAAAGVDAFTLVFRHPGYPRTARLEGVASTAAVSFEAASAPPG